MTRDQGVLYQNADDGIYGRLTDESVYSRQQALETAPKEEIKTSVHPNGGHICLMSSL